MIVTLKGLALSFSFSSLLASLSVLTVQVPMVMLLLARILQFGS